MKTKVLSFLVSIVALAMLLPTTALAQTQTSNCPIGSYTDGNVCKLIKKTPNWINIPVKHDGAMGRADVHGNIYYHLTGAWNAVNGSETPARFYKITPSGTVINLYDFPLDKSAFHPFDFEVDSKGSVFFVDFYSTTNKSVLVEITSNGEYIERLIEVDTTPYNIEISDTDTIYLSGMNGKIYRITEQMQAVQIFDAGAMTSGFEVQSDGIITFGNFTNSQVIQLNESNLSMPKIYQFPDHLTVQNITLDTDGYAYVSTLHKYSNSENSGAIYKIDFSGVHGIVVDEYVGYSHIFISGNQKVMFKIGRNSEQGLSTVTIVKLSKDNAIDYIETKVDFWQNQPTNAVLVGKKLVIVDTTNASAKIFNRYDFTDTQVEKVPGQVVRFFNSQSYNHFYTADKSEAVNLIENNPVWIFEGNAFVVSVYNKQTKTCENGTMVHRFVNRNNGVHFFTASETEKTHIQNTNPNWIYEGIAYCTVESGANGAKPLYRFWNNSAQVHFYTASEDERQLVQQTMPQYTFEDVAYYVK